MDTKRQQQSQPPSPPRSRPYATNSIRVIQPPPPVLPPLRIPPPPLPSYCCPNQEKFKQLRKKLRIETFSQWKIAVTSLLLPLEINDSFASIKLHWYKIKSSISPFEKLQTTLLSERPRLHYILIQGYNRHHLFTQEEIKDDITSIFKKKREKRSISYVIEECCVRSNKYGKSVIGHMQPEVNQLLFIELLSSTRNPNMFHGLLDTIETYINHTCNH